MLNGRCSTQCVVHIAICGTIIDIQCILYIVERICSDYNLVSPIHYLYIIRTIKKKTTTYIRLENTKIYIWPVGHS